jgi:heme exporter protein D
MTLYFHSLSEFFHMGGYAACVWSAYGIAAVALIAAVVVPVCQKKAFLNKAR